MGKLHVAVLAGSLAASVFSVQAVASGEETYNTRCMACHATGAAGAPKLGDKAAWAPRIATGMDALLANATNGKGAMPPKGTCMDCSPEALKAAIEYMVQKSQ